MNMRSNIKIFNISFNKIKKLSRFFEEIVPPLLLWSKRLCQASLSTHHRRHPLSIRDFMTTTAGSFMHDDKQLSGDSQSEP